ncbi:LacI family DNA-binding transcriptional regulator [Clostridium sp. NSJ-6]|uniref:LacI family DNA-binding transcriptional regulator n=1 Tax=Clostridium hominis TaxID=2763036 RepID=A0ABR7DI40_9CLOT|nr:LacI family DNA-binding transcriptional regulator [Clostridium hominis]MBC5631111.1 LacI family DNA-binding transcriptional regulator [Clostridium hominis]MDU2671192.1 LacI family DNA-binding transcriptional regulator [Clostridium sp.]
MNIRDIAKLSGVGVSTVSRVLNNHPDVKESTRERVMQVIKESNYIPNNSARILKQNNTRNIGIFVKGVFNPFFSEMLNVIGSKINESKYTMILQQNDYGLEEDVDTLKSFIKEKRLQGVICLGGNFVNIDEESFGNIDVPVVLTSVNTEMPNIKDRYSTVGIDNLKSAYDATKHLINLGHKNIAIMLGEKNDLCISWWRYKGYKKALEESNIETNSENMLIGNYDTRTAYNETKSFLKQNKEVTAIFAISDIMAVGVAKAVADCGLKVGKDIAIIGFDGMDISEFYNPGITTMKQPKEAMALKSIELLFALLSGKGEHKHILLDTELIERESCNSIN